VLRRPNWALSISVQDLTRLTPAVDFSSRLFIEETRRLAPAPDDHIDMPAPEEEGTTRLGG
jgi:hypothetical protein